mmetsp:Transcript_138433/g.239294  ORF Transcript_138433/g.239294 Transcript_138433/m.239294 type:complete len:823 (-) Transcript_138433:206-2674(-)
MASRYEGAEKEGSPSSMARLRRASQEIVQKFSQPFSEMTKYDEAAWMLDLAMRGKYVVAPDDSSTGLPKKAEAINVYSQYLFFTKIYKYAVLISLALTVFETPLWCNGEGHLWVRASAKHVCVIGEGSYHEKAFLSGVPLIPTGYGIIIEILCFMAIATKIYLEWKLEGYFTEVGAVYRDIWRRREGIVLVTVGIADVLYFCAALDTNFRLAPYVRFCLGATIPYIRKVVRSFGRSFSAIKEVSVFLMGTIILFAWVAALLFYNSDKEDDIAADFRPITTSLYSCFLAVITVNLPDVMVPTVSKYPIYLLFWWALLIVAGIIFMNVILAVVYNDYSDRMEEKQKEFFHANKKGMDNSFDLVADAGADGGLTLKGFKDLCESLSKLHVNVDLTLCSFVFDGLDDDGSGVLGRSEFYDMCDVLQYKFKVTERDSPLQAIPTFRTLKNLCDNHQPVKTSEGPSKLVDLGYLETYPGSIFDHIMNTILGMNVVFILVESVYDLRNVEEPDFFDKLDMVFTYVYMFEVAVKLCVWSWGEYWSVTENKFDFITSMLLAVIGTVILFSEVSKDFDKDNILLILNLLRLVRVVKAIGRVETFKREFTTISKMVQASFDVLLINILVLYIWSAWGLQMFGGQLYKQNGKYVTTPDDYFDGNLMVFNFNDVISGFTTLFFFALTGWVPEIGEAMILLSGTLDEHGEQTGQANMKFKLFTWFFLISFYVASPLIAFNVFTAFSMDVFASIQDQMAAEEELKEKGKAGEEGSIQENLAKVAVKLAIEKKRCLHVKASSAMEQAKVFREMFKDEDDDKEDDAKEAPGVHGDLDED